MLKLSAAATVAVLALAGAACHGAHPDHVEPLPGEQAAATQRPAPPPAARGASRPPAAVAYRGPLPPVPFSPYAAAPADVVQAVYEFAARRPDVMRHVPCFCGCERNGHQDNEDCFVAGRDADGRPRFDTHGLT